MAANLPEITYRFPTLSNGPQSSVRPSIIFDWSTDMDANQFTVNARLNTNVLLIDDLTNDTISLTSVGYTAATKRVEVKPVTNLQLNRKYRVFVRDKLVSTDGRKSFNEYHWVFQVASGSAYDAPLNLLTPGDTTVQAIAPTFSWSPIVFSTAATGAVTYNFQLSTNFAFTTLEYNTTTSASAILPVYTYTEDTTYYWRVSAYTTGASSEWTDVNSFYYGRFVTADPTTRQTLPDADVFGVKKLSFKSGLSHQRQYPSPIAITFYSTPASDYQNYIQTAKKAVYPRNDSVDSYFETTWTGTWSLSGLVATFSPDESIATNTRYEIKIQPEMLNTSGYELGEEYSFWFTGQYTPFYASPRTIRSKFLGAEQQVPEDLINFFIHQASLEANAKYWGYVNILNFSGDNPIEPVVRDSGTLQSYGTLRWVEAVAAYRLLKAILFENLRDIGRTERLGDALVSLTKDFISGIDRAIKLTEEEIDQWDDYLSPSAVPLTIPKSYTWGPESWNSDFSIMDVEARRDDYI
jgi:hypothetical protein